MLKCPICGYRNELASLKCARCGAMLSEIEKYESDIINLGYESARNNLPKTVARGKAVEGNIESLLNKLNLLEGINYSKQTNIQYSNINKYASIKEDFVFSNKSTTILSATHSHPKIPGHSNENKLHQALGELWLLKTFDPDTRCIIYTGGKKDHWLPYVIPAIERFYDFTIHSWDVDVTASIDNALNASLKNKEFWENEKIIRDSYKLSSDPSKVPNANLRKNFFENVIQPHFGVKSIDEISNNILKKMVLISLKTKKKVLWEHLRKSAKSNLWTERTGFNVPEVAFDMLLHQRGFNYKSEIRDGVSSTIIKNNLLYVLGYNNCHRRTDFILETSDGINVYIECKSSGGGEGGKLTKHITDRSREQLARSILHRCTVNNGALISKPKNFYWYYILDGKWRTPNRYPLKYAHVLDMCGVDGYYSCDELVDNNYELNYDFSLLDELERIGCCKI